MSMISEQVKQIRDVADSYREMRCDIYTQKVLYEAADTIEALSAKVMEQNLPVHGEWIEDGKFWKCSRCGASIFPTNEIDRVIHHAYCGVCGAKMLTKEYTEKLSLNADGEVVSKGGE